jgi:hypothetical protein
LITPDVLHPPVRAYAPTLVPVTVPAGGWTLVPSDAVVVAPGPAATGSGAAPAGPNSGDTQHN